jgi:hypothetical protein
MSPAVHAGTAGTTLVTGTVLVTADARVLLTHVPTWLAVTVVGVSLLVAIGRTIVLLAQATIPQESKDRLEWWQTVWRCRKPSSDQQS